MTSLSQTTPSAWMTSYYLNSMYVAWLVILSTIFTDPKMKLAIALSALLLVAITAAAPTKSEDDEKIIVTTNFYPDSLVKYESKHDIVQILLPLNALNMEEDESDSEEDVSVTLFFVEADVDAEGKRIYQGLYVFKDDKATKILDNGRDAAAANDDSKQVFFAGQDGIYKYKYDTNEAVKYGSVTDSIIGIGKPKTDDIVYILTEDHELYKVTDAGTTKTKVDEVVNAEEIVLDYSDNVYFYNAQDKKPYVLTAEGIKDIEGLPTNPTEVKLIKPPFVIEDGVPFIVDNVVYIIYANGSSEYSGFEFNSDAKPTAYAMEGTLMQYYAYNKKIYEYNILVMVLSEILDEIKNYLGNFASDIQKLTSQRIGNKIKT